MNHGHNDLVARLGRGDTRGQLLQEGYSSASIENAFRLLQRRVEDRIKRVSDAAYKAAEQQAAGTLGDRELRQVSRTEADQEYDRLIQEQFIPPDYFRQRHLDEVAIATDRRAVKRGDYLLNKCINRQLAFDEFIDNATMALGEGERILYGYAHDLELEIMDDEELNNLEKAQEAYSKKHQFRMPHIQACRLTGLNVKEAHQQGYIQV